MKATFINISLLLMLSLTSCTDGQSDLPPAGSIDSEYILRISSVSVEGAADAALSRSIITNIGTSGGELSSIGVYTTYTDGTEYKPAHGRNTDTYVYNSAAAWEPSSTQKNTALRLPSSTALHAYAWHPASLSPVFQRSGSYVSGVDVRPEVAFDAADQIDYLYSGAATAQFGTTTDFTLNHALVKFTCRVYKSASLTDEIHLTKLSVSTSDNSWHTGQANIKLTDGVLTGLSNTAKLVMTATDESKIVPEDKDNPVSVYCLVAPVTQSRLRFELEAKSNNQEYSFQTFYVTPSTVTWERGQHIVFTILLDGMDAKVTGVQVCKWEDYSDTYIPVSPEPDGEVTLRFALPQAETRALGAAPATEPLDKGTLFSVYAYRDGKQLGQGVYQVDASDASLASPATIGGTKQPLKLTKGKYDLYFFSYNAAGTDAGDYPVLTSAAIGDTDGDKVSVPNGKDFLTTSLKKTEIQANQSTGTDEKTFSVSLAGAPFRRQCARAKATLQVQEYPVKPEKITALTITVKGLADGGSYTLTEENITTAARTTDAFSFPFSLPAGGFIPQYNAPAPQLEFASDEVFLLPIDASESLTFDLSMKVEYTSTQTASTKTQLVELKNYTLNKQLQAGKSYNFVFRLTFYGDYKPVGIAVDMQEYTPVKLPASGVGED